MLILTLILVYPVRLNGAFSYSQGRSAKLYGDMVELGSDGEGDRDQHSNVPSPSDSYFNSQAILSQQLQYQKQVQETKAELVDRIHEIKKQFLQQLQNIHSAVKRIAIQPVIRISQDEE